ncbi:MAG: hypothetical protein P9M06_04815 [Candidatus Saelkia tenebricola]|nr:hypothetical protein [Candidatus Saelkia tenebricola]
MKMKNIGLVIVLLSFFCLSLEATDYKKEASTSASKPQLPIDELNLINLILTGSNPSADLQGSEDVSGTTLFSGENHDTDGNVITGGKYTIGLNLGEDYIDVNDVTLEGTSGTIEDNVSYTFNISTLAPFLRKNADTTIIEDTEYTNTTLGDTDDYRIIYINNSKLTLSTDFTGYGIIYIEDKDHADEEYILEMLNNATWYGAIIVHQSENEKASKVFLNGTASDEEVGIGDFAIIAIDSMTIGNNLNLTDGSIGVSSQLGSIIVGNNNSFSESLLANTIVLGNHGTIGENIYHNIFIHGNHLNLSGEEITPLTFPVFTLPAFPSFTQGSTSITRNNNTTYTLNAGDYNNIAFGNNCTLYLAGGEYNINKITMGNDCEIRYQAAAALNIKQKVVMGNNAVIINDSSGPDASDCVFYIEGSGLSSSTNVFSLGNCATVYANAYVPNSNITIENNINFKGSLIAKTILIGNNAVASIEVISAFGEDDNDEAQNAEIYGSLLFIGNEFHIPTEGAYVNSYYCQEALENVNDELKSRPYNIWFEWKEVE